LQGRDDRLVKVGPLLALAGDWNALLNRGVGCVKRTIISGPDKYGAFHAPYAAEPWAYRGGASGLAPAQPHRSAAWEHHVCRAFGAYRGSRPITQETRPKAQTTQTAKMGIMCPEFMGSEVATPSQRPSFDGPVAIVRQVRTQLSCPIR